MFLVVLHFSCVIYHCLLAILFHLYYYVIDVGLYNCILFNIFFLMNRRSEISIYGLINNHETLVVLYIYASFMNYLVSILKDIKYLFIYLLNIIHSGTSSE